MTEVNSLLDAREQRYERARELAKSSGRTVIVFSLNMPGLDKRPEGAEEAVIKGFHELEEKLVKAGMFLNRFETHDSACGPAILALVAIPAHCALAVKRFCVSFEESHPYGRIFDVDVYDGLGVPVTRSALGIMNRRCVVCDDDYGRCRLEKRHKPEEVAKIFARLIAEYAKIPFKRMAGRD